MEYDALSAGAYGGLQTKESIKLLVCYIINNISEPLPQNAFCDEMHAQGIANYFELAEAFADLQRKNLIIELENNKGHFALTPIGLETVRELKENIPYSVRKKSFYATINMLKRIKYQEQTKVSTERLPSGEYILSCSIMEGEKEMLTVRINLPDYETAQDVKNNFWDSPENLYSSVLKALMHCDFEFNQNKIEFKDK